MAKIINLNEETFKELVFDFDNNQEWKYQGKVPALIDFWAPWCGPCQMIGPVLEELQNEYGDKIQIFKINTEEEHKLSGLFGIKSIPSLLFVPVGDNPRMAVGALPKESLKEGIKEVLKVEI